MTKLILIRGLPGSGKTTLAKQMAEKQPFELIEADMFFEIDGKYRFNPRLIKKAHEWCRVTTGVALASDLDVIVSNTFTQMWEMKPYFKMARELNVDVEVIECKEVYKNIHNVPKAVLDRMKARWEAMPTI